MRIAIVTDIHEDYPALKKALRKIEKTGYDELVCLGDISGYSVPYYKNYKSRDAHGCLSLLREKESVIIPGNHDFHAARRLPKESSTFVFPENWYDMDTSERKEVSMDRIWLHEQYDLDPLYTKDDVAFLNSLDEYKLRDTGEINILYSHYIYPNMAGFTKGFYTSAGQFSQHFDFMTRLDCSVSFTGHAHVRGYYTVTPNHFKHYPYARTHLKITPVVIGVPPITSHKRRSGFGLFDTEHMKFKASRL